MLLSKLLPLCGMALGVCAMVGFVFWLQASSHAADASPQVRIAQTETSTDAFAQGDVLTVTSVVRNEGSVLQDLTVELEVHAPDGQIVLRAPRQGIKLGSAEDQSVSWVWRLPPDLRTGLYTTEVSVYGPNWSPLYTRQVGGATFTVGPRS